MPQFWLYVALLAIEAAGMTVVAVTVLVQLLTSKAASETSAVALVVLAFLAAAGLVAIVMGVLRGQAWTRAASTVWQILQGAIGVGTVLGSMAGVIPEAFGWPLVVVAVLALIFGVSRSVIVDTSDRTPRN